MYSRRGARRVAYLTITAAVVLAVAFYPFMSKINSVVSTNESSLLPRNVESIEAMNIVERETNASNQSNVIYLVSGVPVNVSTFYRLNGTIRNGTSWLSIASAVYSRVEDESQRLLNASVTIANGIRSLWTAVVNLTDRLDELKASVYAMASLIRNADYVYAEYYSVGGSLTEAYSEVRPQLIYYGNLTRLLSEAYESTFFNALRAEYVLCNMTEAYQTGNLTQADVEAVIENSPQIGAAPPPSPELVQALFNYVKSSGGPSRFSVGVANNFTYTLIYEELNQSGRAGALPLLEYYSGAFYNISSQYPIESLMGNLTVSNQYRLYDMVSGVANYSSIRTFEHVLSSAPAASQQLQEVIMEIGLKYAATGFNESDLNAIIDNVTFEVLSERVPPRVAEVMSLSIANGSFNRGTAAVLAVETIEGYLPEAYQNYSEQISRYVPGLLLEYDVNATSLIYNNETLAADLAATLVSEMTNASPSLVNAVAKGGQPYYLAVSLVNQSAGNAQARLLLGELNSTGPIPNYASLMERMPDILNRTLLTLGLPSNLTPLLTSSTLRVLNGTSTYGVELVNVTDYLFNGTFGGLLSRMRGTLVQSNLKGFAVFISGNPSYSQALNLGQGILSSLRSKGYSNVTVMLTGTQILNYEMSSSSRTAISRSDLIGALLVLVILAVVLESIVAVLLPFTGVGLGLVVALGVGYLLASHGVITLNSISRTIMYEAGLGLGIDYSSLISRRFREEYARTGDPVEAASTALRRSWRAVVTGALTAAIGFGSMAIATNFPFLTSLGETVPISILITMAVSLTVIPALLSLIGGSRVLWWPSRVRVGADARGQGHGSVSRRMVERSLIVLAVVVVLLVPAAYVYATFKGSYDFTLLMPQGAEAVRALHYMSENYAAGLMYPDYVVGPNMTALQHINQSISKLGCVQSTQLINASKPVLQVVLSVYPLGKEAISCTEAIRQAAKNVSGQAMVGGEAAINLDLEHIVYHDFYHLVYPVAIALMFLVLLAFFESVPMALTALGSVVFSAIFGGALAIEVFRASGVTLPWFLPIVVFTAILGVGMDYNSFIINRIREEGERSDVKEAVSTTISKTGTLVVGLSTIMAGAFSGLLEFSAPGFRGMGLALMAGVLIAGIMASLLFTPAVIYILGDLAWWPSKPKRGGQRA